MELVKEEAWKSRGRILLSMLALGVVPFVAGSEGDLVWIPRPTQIAVGIAALVGMVLAVGRLGGGGCEGDPSLPRSRVSPSRVWLVQASVGWLGILLAIAAHLVSHEHTDVFAPHQHILVLAMSLFSAATLTYFATLLCSTALRSSSLAGVTGIALSFTAHALILHIYRPSGIFVSSLSLWFTPLDLVASIGFATLSAWLFIRGWSRRAEGVSDL